MEEDMLVLNITLLNNHTSYMDIQAGNDAADSTVSAFSHSSLC